MTPKKTKKTPLTPLGQFDKLTASIRVTIYLYNNPKTGISTVIKNTGADQKAVYNVKNWLEKNDFLIISKKDRLPYTPVLSLNEKGNKIAEYLVEIAKIIEP
jgi:hypothetical protein